ncbi:hypothetical protein A2Z33_06265 [Candidatus Gottesmanbacteria bacterium RBG_16_52_11]|uniref:Uncharacterized protein n=1 Tax=Candidatus Gottesmanbacteria bacterium RBG_16_52_11 TaxID=1798374 RepID=A0A1F5YXF1_9BACT|nr:MAG: hypothetical protein A2Z33_06265 [Candidatus Gottesmanbacteria bacterium RBG_16_52_11]
MSQIITYQKSPSGKYCQIKFDDGNRILISLAQVGVKISRLKWGGLIPAETILEISTPDLFSDKYKPVREKLTEISLEPDFLDVFKDLLLPIKSLDEARKTLDKIFTV